MRSVSVSAPLASRSPLTRDLSLSARQLVFANMSLAQALAYVRSSIAIFCVLCILICGAVVRAHSLITVFSCLALFFVVSAIRTAVTSTQFTFVLRVRVALARDLACTACRKSFSRPPRSSNRTSGRMWRSRCVLVECC